MSIISTIFGGSALEEGAGVTLQLHPNYGWVVLTAVGSMFMLVWKGFKVGGMRKKFKIYYPTMYADEKMGEEGKLFNCYQRAHQNTMESYPQFLTLLLLGGLEMPVFSAIVGSTWIMGRIVYAKGYYTGDPRQRMTGVKFGTVALLMLLGATAKFAQHLICK